MQRRSGEVGCRLVRVVAFGQVARKSAMRGDAQAESRSGQLPPPMPPPPSYLFLNRFPRERPYPDEQ
jgi:hypothetical protein